MKRILLLLSVLLFASAVTAQDAAAILTKYYKLTGLDKIDQSKVSALIDTEITVNGQTISMSCAIQMPSKMRIVTTMLAQKATIVINGDKNSISIPGMPVQSLPTAQMEQFRKQTDLLSSMKWNLNDYTLTLKSPETKDGKTYDVVELIPNNKAMPFKSQTLQFNRKTGLVDFATIVAPSPQGGSDITITTSSQDYVKSSNGMLYPSTLETSLMGITTTIHITKFEMNCPVSDDLFEIAQ